MAQLNMQKLDRKFKIRFTKVQDDSIGYIEAPLPEQFGMTVGSEFSAPFDASALAGILQKAKLPFAGGLSRRVGVVTTKMYSNPEPTEISFDLEFHAETSARHEVLEPIVSLMTLSLGSYYDSQTISDEISKIRGGIGKLYNLLGGDEGAEEDSFSGDFIPGGEVDVTSMEGVFGGSGPSEEGVDNALAFIGLIKAPSLVRVDFGHVFSLSPVWVSSVGVQFSNVLDAEGFPLSATASVTIVLQRDPVANDVKRFFGMA